MIGSLLLPMECFDRPPTHMANKAYAPMSSFEEFRPSVRNNFPHFVRASKLESAMKLGNSICMLQIRLEVKTNLLVGYLGADRRQMLKVVIIYPQERKCM